MIVSVLLRNFKTYNKNHLIPITNHENFCALIGDNGIGKSSVLEALNTYFKGKDWELNITMRKNKTLEAYIVPVFLIPKKEVPEDLLPLMNKISNYLWEIEEVKFNSSVRRVSDVYIKQRDLLERNFDKEKFFLVSVGLNHFNTISLGIFKTKEFDKVFVDELIAEETDVGLTFLAPILEWIKSYYHYIYIPKDMNPSDFLKLETNEIQELMGENLSDIISGAVSVKDISKINTSLNKFLSQIADELKIYDFRTSEKRQKQLNKADVNSLIVKAFFSVRKLFKKEGDQWIKMSSLSSGEKQKAIIEVAHNLVLKHRKNSENLIIAVDEPESSLHISACFKQFRKLYQLSNSINQMIFTSHWYGFIPIIETGSITAITKESGEHSFDNLDIGNYREEIKQLKESSNGVLPFDVRLKSINDFIQTLVSSLIDRQPYNWIICEGSSEKIYFNYLFKEKLGIKNLQIIPVGGATEIKRIYESFEVSIKYFKSSMTGKIAFLTDTDAQLVEFPSLPLPNVLVRRYVNDDKIRKATLVSIDKAPKTPVTDIERILDGRVFHETLLHFKPLNEELEFLDSKLETEFKELNSYYCLDIKQSNQIKLDLFFKKKGIKYQFAKKYVDISKSKDYENLEPLNWMLEIQKFFN